MKRVIAAFTKNRVFANIAVLLIFMAGGVAGISIVRENNPSFSLDRIMIAIPFPGADPEEVEEGINQKIEEQIDGMEGIKQYTTYSSENAGTVIVEFKDGYDVDKMMSDVRTKVESISTFPVDAERPIIQEMIIDEQVMLLALAGDMSERRLKEWAERIKDDIQQLPKVSQVQIMGIRDYEIGIEVSEERLREYGLTFDEVADAIRRSNINLAGGTIRTRGEEIRVRTVGRKYTGEEFSSIVVLAKPSGETVTLDRLATINDGFVEVPNTTLIDGQSCLLLNVMKANNEDALSISKEVQAYIKEKQQQLPEGIELNVVMDNTDKLRTQLSFLTRNGIIGLGIVFLLLWAFLNFRLSFWVGLGIPISLAGALTVLWAVGGTINSQSIFGFIMVMGIIVDDAIVVGESIYVHRKAGESPLKAAIEGLSEVAMPVITAVITSIVAFIPLMFVGGISGKFISIFPVVVIVCLSVSLIECLILLPAHLSHLPDPNTEAKNGNPLIRFLDRIHDTTSLGMEWFVEHIYTPFLSKALNWRYILVCVALSLLLLTLGLVQGGIVKFSALPEIDGFVITANVRFPDGTPAEVTEKALKRMDEALTRLNGKIKTRSGDPLVETRLSILGRSLSEMEGVSGPHVGGMQALLLESEKRGIHSKEVTVAWEKEIGSIPGATSLTFMGMQGGPPGSAIEVWLQGRTMDDILAATDDLKDRLARYDGVNQIRSDYSPGKTEMRLRLKPEARGLGITVSDLARQVYSGFYGNEAVRLQRGRDDVRVKVRYTAGERSKITDLEQIRIRTRSGQELPLLSVADITFEPGYSTITRTNGIRRVMVSADVDSARANAGEVLSDLGEFFKQLEYRYPGMSIALKGEQENMRDALGSLLISFPLAII
ncbi:MAG: efflux RND transporter permease subunit, partial [Desulfobacterales bacterium]